MAKKSVAVAAAPVTPSLAATKRAQRAPSTVVTVQAAPAPAPAAPAAPAKAVALRGGLALTSVRLTDKVYRVGASHNADWWAIVTRTCGADGATVQALLAAGVPAPFIGYTFRRGYLRQA